MGDKGVVSERRGRVGSSWWSGVLNIGEGDLSMWFWGNLVKEVGEGDDTSYWEGLWVGSATIKSLFPKLFFLSLQKNCKICEIEKPKGGRWVGMDLGLEKRII